MSADRAGGIHQENKPRNRVKARLNLTETNLIKALPDKPLIMFRTQQESKKRKRIAFDLIKFAFRVQSLRHSLEALLLCYDKGRAIEIEAALRCRFYGGCVPKAPNSQWFEPIYKTPLPFLRTTLSAYNSSLGGGSFISRNSSTLRLPQQAGLWQSFLLTDFQQG